ncbi:MAG: hypothetical protein V2I76_14425 [Roseobacter sp.]|nr:hypothetical protein [Roseobacter sp.]
MSNIVKRLDKYQDRLARGKVEKIKPHHVQKMIAKLTMMEARLAGELADTVKPEKRKRVESKVLTIREQIEKAKWLETQI